MSIGFAEILRILLGVKYIYYFKSSTYSAKQIKMVN